MTDPLVSRVELVERLIAAERRARLAEEALRDWAEHVAGDRSQGSYVVALHARLSVLEENVRRMARKGKAA
jgi:hypothetical protein